MGSAIFNTIRIPLLALILVVLFATFIHTCCKRNLFTNLIDSLSMVPYRTQELFSVLHLSLHSIQVFGSGFLMITGTADYLLSVRRLLYNLLICC